MSELNPSILVVDDDKDIREFVARVLQHELACEILYAEDGSQALNLCRDAAPDLVLLDMIMPGVDGFNVAKSLKNMGIPFIAMTAMVSADTILRLNTLGSFSFLAKPVSHAQLLGTVLSAVSHIRHIKALQKHANNNCDICTARGAISAYLRIHPDQAFDVINEMGRDQQGSAADTAKIVNQFLNFIATANEKHNTQLARNNKRGRDRDKLDK